MDDEPERLDALTRQAGRWLALSAAPAERHTTAVVAGPYDRVAWRDVYARSAALRELSAQLLTRHAHAPDLLADVFLCAYQAAPRLRERAVMAPSHLVHHQVVTALTQSPDFAALHRETAGDAYAAAMAVLAQGSALRGLLERSREARERTGRADRARQEAEAAATAVGEALRQAAEEADGQEEVPAPAAAAVRRAAEAAREAEESARREDGAAAQAMAAAVPGIRSAARNAASAAAEAVRQEAALMRAWGVDAGETERMPFEERARLAERLRSGRLARWAELIGRFRQMAAGERARKVEHATGELVGVTLGDDLSRVIPSELAVLGVPELRAVFAARYAAGELMLYDSRGEQGTGKGAVIACVDTSHSMYAEGPGGITREAWSKACALALLDQARHAGRDFVGILFSAADKLQVFRFPGDRPAPVTDVLDFAETFLGGGTDFQRPLGTAAKILEEEFDSASRARGDIVLITDDACEVSENWTRLWNEIKRRLDFRLFGVAIATPDTATASGSVLETLCDNLRTVDDLTDVHTTADLFRVI
ncbi:VWA domain-containing protein [Streptomyces althioticus]|uniref:VWA domain-containing protein n=1 Tax=Streptomyces TaxID=1883 RepID=UPI0005251217|nr:VWA domain-containing protein [Actinospica acidiphila]MCC9687966.1 VWA domain-containing protein [Streptomyces sp. MNU103]